MSCEFTYTPNEYKSDLKPVWCPGCGDFGVLNSLYRAFADLRLDPHETVVVSGIGCSSRLPGYVESYGFNSLHGPALPIATGITASPLAGITFCTPRGATPISRTSSWTTRSTG